MHGRVSRYLRRQHLALVVVFLALCGGSAYALDGSNTVFSDDIVEAEVRGVDVLDDSVRTDDVRDDALEGGGLTNSDLAPVAVGSTEIADDSVESRDVRDDSLSFEDLLPGSVGASELDAGPFTGEDIYEPLLGTVPVSTIAGKGRSTVNHADCDVPDTTYKTCAVLQLPVDRDARFLAIWAGRLPGGNGRCRIRIDAYVSHGALVGPFVSEAVPTSYFNLLSAQVIGPYPPGDPYFALQCSGSIYYGVTWDDLQLSVVGLSQSL